MSAEVTVTKRRGRPPKKAVPTTGEADNVIVVVEKAKSKSANSNTSSTRAATAKKSASTSASTSAATSSSASKSTTTSPATTKRTKAVDSNADADPGKSTTTPASTTTRKRAVKSAAASSSSSAAAKVKGDKKQSEGELSSAASSKRPKKGIIVDVERSDTDPTHQPTKTTTTTTTTTTIATVSEILAHAKAFTRQSSDLQQQVLELVSRREKALFAASKQAQLEPEEVVVAEQPTAKLDTEAEATVDQIRIPDADKSFNSSSQPISVRVSQSEATTTSTPQSASASAIPPTAQIPPSMYFRQPPPYATYPPPPSPSPRTVPSSLPFSTIAALSARRTTLPGSSARAGGGGPGPTLPPHSSLSGEPQTGSRPPGPPRPTEMPLEQLKKDPAYRALARRYSSLIVALPFAIVSSYFLYGRYQEHQAYLKARDAKAIVGTSGARTGGGFGPAGGPPAPHEASDAPATTTTTTGK